VETLYDETYSYRGFSPDQGATEVFLPSVHRNLAGQFTHTLVQNLTAGSNTVTITYFNQAGVQVDQFSTVIGPNGSYTFHTTGPFDFIPTNLGNVGSAKLTATGNIVAVVSRRLARPRLMPMTARPPPTRATRSCSPASTATRAASSAMS